MVESLSGGREDAVRASPASLHCVLEQLVAIEPTGICKLYFLAYNIYQYIFWYTAAVPCPIGNMRNETSGTNIANCFPCMGGFYCDQPVAIEPVAICK